MESELIHNQYENTPSPQSFTEFLIANPQIRNISLVFAHPDDPEGYAGGLLSQLAVINSQKSPVDRYTIDITIVTDGANGTTDLAVSANLAATRRIEQLAGLAIVLGDQYNFTSINFLDHPDSKIDIAKLTTEIAELVDRNGSDLIITHDTKKWGYPSSNPNPTMAVQNHADHRDTANAVITVIARMEDAGSDNIPLLLKATWEPADIEVEFDPQTKLEALKAHTSQYSPTMGDIVHQLNRGEQRYKENFAFAKQEARRQERMRSALFQIAGVRGKNPPAFNQFLAETFAQECISRVLLINDTLASTWTMEGLSFDRLCLSIDSWDQDEFERFVRENQIDFLVIPYDLSGVISEGIHKVMAFLSCVSHPGFESTQLHKIKGTAQLMPNANPADITSYQINIGLW